MFFLFLSRYSVLNSNTMYIDFRSDFNFASKLEYVYARTFSLINISKKFTLNSFNIYSRYSNGHETSLN